MNFVETETVQFAQNQAGVILIITETVMFNHEHIESIRKFQPDKDIREQHPTLDLAEILINGDRIVINASYENIKREIHIAQVGERSCSCE